MKRPMTLHFYRSPAGADWYDRAATGWRWRIRASNGRIIADSAEAYGRLADCVRGAGLVTGMSDAMGRLRPGEVSYLTLRHEDDANFRVVVDE